MIYVTLPKTLMIDGLVNVQEWRTRNYCVLQNYSDARATSSQPLLDRTPQIVGENWFSVFRVIQHNPGEELGEKIGTFTHLQAAIDLVEKQEQLA